MSGRVFGTKQILDAMGATLCKSNICSVKPCRFGCIRGPAVGLLALALLDVFPRSRLRGYHPARRAHCPTRDGDKQHQQERTLCAHVTSSLLLFSYLSQSLSVFHGNMVRAQPRTNPSLLLGSVRLCWFTSLSQQNRTPLVYGACTPSIPHGLQQSTHYTPTCDNQWFPNFLTAARSVRGAQ